jgi:hypothetical protein
MLYWEDAMKVPFVSDSFTKPANIPYGYYVSAIGLVYFCSMYVLFSLVQSEKDHPFVFRMLQLYPENSESSVSKVVQCAAIFKYVYALVYGIYSFVVR